MNELQRIGRILGIKADVDDSRLCLMIQDKIKKKDSLVKEKTFCYHMVKTQNQRLESQIHNLKNEYAESVGVVEHVMLQKSYKNLKSDYKKVLEDRHNLNETIRKYKEREFKDRLKKIEGVR